MNPPQLRSDAFSQHLASPSSALLSAALLGLLGPLAGACGDDGTAAGPMESEADAGLPDADPPDAGATDAADAASDDAGAGGPIVTKEVPGQRSYASLIEECDQRGGYVQVHASCSGANSCAGFSYGDWGDGSVLSEHTCASMNGCNGLSCVVLPEDSGLAGATAYALGQAPAGPSSCTNCHAVWSEGNVDLTKFKVWLREGDPRTVETWLEVSPEAQERVVAFGRNNVLPDGTPVVSMKGYHKLFSRAEIQRVVAHIRTLTPVISIIGVPE